MSDMATETRPYRFTAHEFFALAERGALRRTRRIELRDGSLFEMSPVGPPHGLVVAKTITYLSEMLASRALVLSPVSVRLDDWNVPEPDVSVFAPDAMMAWRGYADAAQAHAFVEVADASEQRDRTSKRDLYARFDIPEYLVCSIASETIVRHRDPCDGRYARIETLARGDTFALGAFADVRLAVERFFR